AAQAEALRIQQELERQVSQQQAASVQTQSAFDTQISALREERDAAALAYEQALAEAEARASALDDRLRAEIADAEREFASEKAGLEVQLAQAQTDLQTARRSTLSTEDQRAEVEARLLMALEKLEDANAVAQDKDLLQSRLLAALDRQETAESAEAESRTLAEQRAALLDQARNALSQEQEVSSEAQRQTALLNQQVAALREQLGGLQALLDDYEARDVARSVQLQSLGQDLNSALARAASEERKRRLLEEAERKRLEDEAATLALKTEALEAESEDLARYRSEFFGRLRDVLGNQDGVRIQGDRFVFASEVLFDVGSADLSAEGEAEIAKVARILQSVAAAIPTELNWIIRVDGHTDNDPLINHPKFADNWELSQGRALSVVRFMVEGLGLPPERLAANGFGEYQPVNPADTAEARAQNRRIELKFTER
ncbi:MAG: peptidoglycan -binding protein, partial [Marinomonas sp.]